MTAFRVWAPRPDGVALALGDARRLPMTRDADDWWSVEVPDAGPGTDYGFVLDGSGPFPDPRSAFQPDGVHGLSRLVDHDAFAWTDGDWAAPPLAEAVFYEIHVGTFSAAGTFDGAIDHLDGLVQLGVTHVEVMPVAEFPGRRGWGYDGVQLFAPHHAYGGPDGLRRLVDACHARGLAVVLDVVYNHLGPDGNYLGLYGPYFSHRYSTPWGEAVNFDARGSDEVRRFAIDNARLWLEAYHFDGLRLDAVHDIYDRSAVPILEELAGELHDRARELGRRFDVIAESDLNDPRLVRPPEAGGMGLDAQWLDDFRHSLHVALTGETDGFHAQYVGLADLAMSLEVAFVYTGRYSTYRGRRHGRAAGDLPATRFIGFLQNHDMTGNRPFGERAGALMSFDGALVGAALVILSPFVPLLFAGQEWNASTPFLYFTDHVDPVLGAAIQEGRRRDFAALIPPGGDIPDPQAEESFLRSRLDWSERSAEPGARMLDWHRRLIAYRRDHPGLRDGTMPVVRVDLDAGWLTASRNGITIAANFSTDSRSVPLEGVVAGRLALASSDQVRLDGPLVELPPVSVAVIES